MTSPQGSTGLGSFYVLAFVILTALQEVYLGGLFQTEHLMVVVMITYGIATLIFAVVQLRSWTKFKRLIQHHLITIIFFNISTSLSFGGALLALVYIEPAIASMISFAIGPVISAFCWRWLRPQSPILPAEKLAALGVLLGLCVLMIATLSGKSAITQLPTHSAILGLFFAFLSALGGIASTFLAKKLSESGFTPSAVTSVRFPLLFLFGLLFSLKNHEVHTPLGKFLWIMLFLSIFTIVIPTFLFQKGLQRSEPMTIFLVAASSPLFVYGFQMLDSRLRPSALTLMGIGLGFFSSVLGIVARRYQTMPHKN